VLWLFVITHDVNADMIVCWTPNLEKDVRVVMLIEGLAILAKIKVGAHGTLVANANNAPLASIADDSRVYDIGALRCTRCTCTGGREELFNAPKHATANAVDNVGHRGDG